MVPKALIRRDQISNQKNPPSVYKVYHQQVNYPVLD
jgi:hypothetical protein